MVHWLWEGYFLQEQLIYYSTVTPKSLPDSEISGSALVNLNIFALDCAIFSCKFLLVSISQMSYCVLRIDNFFVVLFSTS